jgi:inosine/xanthosine triphosphate pyrophosphatase family protein
MTLTFVTGNENKWAEIQAILGGTIALRREKIDCINRNPRHPTHV